MALLFADGWDKMRSTDVRQDHRLQMWHGGTWQPTLPGYGNYESIGSSAAGSGGLVRYFNDATLGPVCSGSTAITGAAIQTANIGVITQVIAAVYDGTTVQLDFFLNMDGTVSARRGGVTVLGTSTEVLPDLQNTFDWIFVELKVTIHDTAGTVDMRVWTGGGIWSGGTPTTFLALTGVDTKQTATTNWTAIRWRAGAAMIDDVYMSDGTGVAPQNDWLGAVRVASLMALRDGLGIGTYQELTPFVDADHGAMVDEYPADGTMTLAPDETYTAGAAAGLRDTYRFETLANAVDIFGVQVTPAVRKSDGGRQKSITYVVRSGGADHETATARPVPTRYRLIPEMFQQNPVIAAPWTLDAVNAVEAGVKVGESLAARTRFYLHQADSNYPGPPFTLTIRGAWDQPDGSAVGTAEPVYGFLDSEKLQAAGAQVGSQSINENSAVNPHSVLVGRGVTGPLEAQTVSGTINVCLAVNEGASAANMHWYLHVYATEGDTDVVRGTLLDNYSEVTNEWPFTATFKGLSAAAALSSLAISEGDRVVLEIGYISREANATLRTGQIWFGTMYEPITDVQGGIPAPDATAGGTDVNDKAGYVDFSVGLTEKQVSLYVNQVSLQVVYTYLPPVVEVDPDGVLGPIPWVEWPRRRVA